jgi:hypothetical protein
VAVADKRSFIKTAQAQATSKTRGRLMALLREWGAAQTGA